MKRRKLLTLAILVVLPQLLIGCATSNSVTSHGIEGRDIFPIEKGTVIGNQVTDRPGWFFSTKYVKDILDLKVDH